MDTPGTTRATAPLPFMTSSRPNLADHDKALDQWVRDALTDAYGDVADERLPDEWVSLLGAPPWEHGGL